MQRIVSVNYLQIGGSYIIAKVKDYPKFRAIEVAIERSGFKVWALLPNETETSACRLFNFFITRAAKKMGDLGMLFESLDWFDDA